MAVNVTTFSEAMWQSYFGVTSGTRLDDGNGNYTVPMTYQQMTTPFDPALPVQFKYIQDFGLPMLILFSPVLMKKK